jgi:pyrrolidone-carboxylate peptidase
LLFCCCSILKAQRISRIRDIRVLLTGFEPYGEWEVNPSREIVKQLDGKNIRGAKVEKRATYIILRGAQSS